MDGYRLALEWNDSYAFRDYPLLTDYQRIHQALVPDISGPSKIVVKRCEKCGDLTNKWDESLAGLVIKERQYDVSVTYDGVVVVSDVFKRACDVASLSGLAFRRLPSDPGFYSIRPLRVVPFDYERRKTRFLNKCDMCGAWEAVVGATPVFLKAGSVIGDREFVRTDLEFGNLDRKHPLILCGMESPSALQNLGLNVACFVEFITGQERRAMEKQRRDE
jgi:hypothetical protein